MDDKRLSLTKPVYLTLQVVILDAMGELHWVQFHWVPVPPDSFRLFTSLSFLFLSWIQVPINEGGTTNHCGDEDLSRRWVWGRSLEMIRCLIIEGPMIRIRSLKGQSSGSSEKSRSVILLLRWLHPVWGPAGQSHGVPVCLACEMWIPGSSLLPMFTSTPRAI